MSSKRGRRRRHQYIFLDASAEQMDGAEREAAQEAFEKARESQEFGRSVPPTLSAFEDVARQHGNDGLASALIARSNQRWENIIEALPFAGSIVIPRTWRLPPIDYALSRFGVDYSARPDWRLSTSHLGSRWPDQLRWGADAIACAAKYLLLFQFVGAAALLRQQAERWTDNRANALGIVRRSGVSRADFISAVWSQGYPRRIDVGNVYRTASDALHGRGPALDLIRWESAGLAESPLPPAAIHIGIVSELALLAQHQLTACVLDLARTGDLPDIAEIQHRWRDVGDPPTGVVYSKLEPTLLPLSPAVLASSVPRDLIVDGEIYERQLQHPGELSLPDVSLSVLAYLHRRHRAYQVAVYALEQEQKQLGDEFDLAGLASHETRYVLVAELAALVGMWTGGDHGDALIVAGSALRSSFQLWLEDDTRSMIAARTVFESVARARTWRIKPDRARKLEQRTDTSGRDWFRAAGWNRLALLGNALGELSHSAYDSRWDGALRALASLHGEQGRALNTARGGTLSRAAYMLAIESIAQLEVLSKSLADTARNVIGVSADWSERGTEAWLHKAAAQKQGFDFGRPVFREFSARDIDRIKEMQRRARPNPTA